MRIVFEISKPSIAILAQKTTHFFCFVIVVYITVARLLTKLVVAYLAKSVLVFKHFVVTLHRNAVLVFQSNVLAMLLLFGLS